VEHGVVVNWAALEQVWQHVFTTELQLETPHDHPVMLAEYPLRTSNTREQAAQLMFETFGVPAFTVAAQAALSLYAAGRLTGVALSSGDGVTYAEPVYEGLAMPGSTSTLYLAGRDLTDHLAGMLDASPTTAQGGGEPHHPAFFSDDRFFGFSLAERCRRREVARDIKEKLCYVPQDYDHDRNQQAVAGGGSWAPLSEYVLPDGRTIGVTSKQLFECLEALFNPALAGCEQDGIHVTLYDAVMKSPMEIRNDLYANIVLAGGTTLAAGFVQRLRREVHGLMPSGLRLGVVADPGRRFLEWRGGAALASLSTIEERWISRQDYDEHGCRVVHNKCP
jgi:actin-related protein